MNAIPLKASDVIARHDACLARADWPQSDAAVREAGAEHEVGYWFTVGPGRSGHRQCGRPGRTVAGGLSRLDR